MEKTIEENVHRLCQQRAAAMDLSAASGGRAGAGRCWLTPRAALVPESLPLNHTSRLPRHSTVKRLAGSKEQGGLTVRDVALLLRQPEEGDADADDELAAHDDAATAGAGTAGEAVSPRQRAAHAAAARLRAGTAS